MPDPTAPTAWRERRPPDWFARALVTTVLAVVAAILVWRALAMLRTVATIVVVSWFLALAMEPVIAWLVRRGLRRTRATGLVMVASLVVVLGMLALLGGLFVTQLIDLVRSLPDVYARLATTADARFGLHLPSQDELVSTLGARWQDLAPGILGIGTSLLSAVFTGTAVLLVVYYTASAGPRLRASICRYLAPDRQREVLRLWEISQSKVADFIGSRIVLAAVSTVATFVVLTATGSPTRCPWRCSPASCRSSCRRSAPTSGVRCPWRWPSRSRLCGRSWSWSSSSTTSRWRTSSSPRRSRRDRCS